MSNQANNSMSRASQENAAEQQLLKKDVLQAVIINLVFFGLLIGLYFWNRTAGHPLDDMIRNFMNL